MQTAPQVAPQQPSQPRLLSTDGTPATIAAEMFSRMREEMPLDGILIGFLDNATFTTYWLTHYGTANVNAVPCAFVHTGVELSDLMQNSTWDQEGGWMRVLNDPGSTVLGKFFVNHMQSSDFSIIHVRSSYDNSKRGHCIFYTRNQGIYTQTHADVVARYEWLIMLLISNSIKDFLLQQLQAIHAPIEEKKTQTTEIYDLVAVSPGMLEIVHRLEFVSQLSTPVLLTGETGVGKEMIADFIHMHSPRRDMPFIKINCGAIPPSLLDSELFGHEKGAFTGAVMQKAGCFELAHKGTLLLDEMGEMPLDVQVRLLRVLQTGSFMRIGGNKSVHTDTRVIASTNRDLEAMLRESTLREDLYYRLNVYHIHIPALRERLEDLSLLVRILMRKMIKKLQISVPPIVQERNMAALAAHPWRGNVRELQNAIEASLINYMMAPSPEGLWIAPNTRRLESDANISAALNNVANPAPEQPAQNFDEGVRTIISAALRQCDGKIHGANGAAALLGLNESTLWGKLKKYGIRPHLFKK